MFSCWPGLLLDSGEDVRNSGTEPRRPDVKFQVVIAPVHRLQIVAVNTELKVLYTGKKRKQNFPKYKEIQMGSVAKSYLGKGFLI